MKNSIVGIVIVAIIAVLGVGAFTLSQKSKQTSVMMKKETPIMEKTETAMKKMILLRN